jgi:hypothetical protein
MIEPDGSVSLWQLHGSHMSAPDLAVQVVQRVKTCNFGAKVVPPGPSSIRSISSPLPEDAI